MNYYTGMIFAALLEDSVAGCRGYPTAALIRGSVIGGRLPTLIEKLPSSSIYNSRVDMETPERRYQN